MRMRLSALGRATVASTLLLLATTFSVSRPAQAQDAGIIVAAITLLQTTLTSLLNSLFQSVITEQLMGTGNTAIVEQIAADTLGVQQALQHHVSATVEAMTRQTIEEINDTNRREFGTLGQVTIGGRRVNIGSNAPSACRRTRDARVLAQGGELLSVTQQTVLQSADSYNRRFKSQTELTGNMITDQRAYGDSVFALDWLQQTSLGEDSQALDRATRSIQYATNGAPLPPAPKVSTAAGAEYAVRLAQHQQAVKLPQAVLARQLALRRPIPGDGQGRSYMQVMTDWGRQAAEDWINPPSVSAKTTKGVLAEQTLQMNALVAMQAETIKAQHDTNALLAIIAASSLNEESKALRLQYENSVNAE